MLFHRTQADALGHLEEDTPENAVQAINTGLETMRQFFVKHEAEEHFEGDELVVRLIELRESLRKEYEVGSTLMEKLAEAVRERALRIGCPIAGRTEQTRVQLTIRRGVARCRGHHGMPAVCGDADGSAKHVQFAGRALATK